MLGVPINMYCNSLYIEKNYCKVKFNFTLMALALCCVLLSVGSYRPTGGRMVWDESRSQPPSQFPGGDSGTGPFLQAPHRSGGSLPVVSSSGVIGVSFSPTQEAFITHEGRVF